MTLRLFIVQCIFLSKGAKPKKKKKKGGANGLL